MNVGIAQITIIIVGGFLIALTGILVKNTLVCAKAKIKGKR